VLISGEARPLDVGDVNGRTFLLYAALGLYPLFVRERERHEESTGRHSLIAYARALWSTLRRFPNLTVRLSADQQVAVSETPFVFVTNRIGMTERLPFGTVTCPQMGQLGIYTAHRADRMGLLRLLAHMRFAPLQEAVDLQAACAGEVLIETRQRHVWLAADGEVMRVETPLRVTLRSRALSVLMPAAVAEPARTS
jgi:diacylglycerol kinase family enzyme